MPELTISEVAREVGLQASAIRYYEKIGLLPRAPRMSGQRRFDTTALYRLAIIQRARQLGFTLTEIRHLFFGFRDTTRASERWRTLSQRKLAELDDLMDGIKAVRGVLKKLMTKCRCDTLDQCGKGIFQNMKRDVVAKPFPANHRHREKYPTSLRTDVVGALRIVFGISAFRCDICDLFPSDGPLFPYQIGKGLPTTWERSVRSALRRCREVIVEARRVSMCLFRFGPPSLG